VGELTLELGRRMSRPCPRLLLLFRVRDLLATHPSPPAVRYQPERRGLLLANRTIWRHVPITPFRDSVVLASNM
jgi:hypothetical protein